MSPVTSVDGEHLHFGCLTDSVGGGIHHTAIIGSPPELRDWKPGDPCHGVKVAATARIHAYVTIDAGAHRPTEIGPRTFCMKHAHVGHDVTIGADCELAPGAVICGDVTIGHRVRIGVNASIRPGIVIGDGARIGAGSVVTKNVPPGEIWAGVPAKALGSKTDAYGRSGEDIAKLTAA